MRTHLSCAARKRLPYLFVFLFFTISISTAFAQIKTRVEKVVLQGFWWDYYNKNFSSAWSN